MLYQEKHMLKEMNWKDAVTIGSPYPYLLVTGMDKDGKPNAMGVGWWSFTSMNPPLMLVSIGKTRYTLECIRHTKDFVACFPSDEQAAGAWMCGGKTGRGRDKLKEAGLSTIPAKSVKSPIIAGSTAAFECSVVNEIETGDHIVVVGRIVAMHGDTDRPMHLYSVFYERLIGLDTAGTFNKNPTA
jgi:flavin reductase (DIM6/NTAB) family NADH-FMN oxidoreductase RutF